MNPDGTVLFDKFGIVKTLETDKVDQITQRIIDRQVDNGDFKLRNDTWGKTRIKDQAEQQCGAVNNFLAPSGAQEMLIFVRSSVC